MLQTHYARWGSPMKSDTKCAECASVRDALTLHIGRLEAKLDMVLARLDTKDGPREAGHQNSPLARLTTKQHATLQMLLTGRRNREIAERFGVTENTAKVYVRAISSKLGCTTRTQIALIASPLMEALTDEDYRLISGGLPKDWEKNYAEPDPYAGLYRHAKE